MVDVHDGIDPDKYVVFKREDFNWGGMTNLALDDAVVIRLQDIFAGPGLHAYAASISTAIELMEGGATLPLVASAHLDRLRSLRDYFHEMATRADAHPRKKIPD